jgi:DNA-binding cell septation regulator SpoVG
VTWLDGLVLDTVIVHTKGGQSLKGLRAAVYDDCLVLRDVSVLEPEGNVLLDGLVSVPRENVDFMQLIQSQSGAA